MRILLADDERMVRLGLISMIEDLFPGKHTLLEAKDGEELVETAKACQPDIIFIDIRMPVLNGLEGLEKVRLLSPDSLCIILSGFAEFEYAQAAIKHGAVEYLLKPVSIERLEEVLGRMSGMLCQRLAQRNASFTAAVMNTANQAGGARPFVPQFLWDYAHFESCIFCVDQPQGEERKQLCSALEGRLRQLLDEMSQQVPIHYALFYNNPGGLCLVVCQKSRESGGLNGIFRIIRHAFDGKVTVLTGESGSLAEACASLHALADAAPLRICLGMGKCIPLKEIETYPQKDLLKCFSLQLEELAEAFLDKEELTFKQLLSDLETDAGAKAAFALSNASSLRCYFEQLIRLKVDVSGYSSFLASIRPQMEKMFQGNAAEEDMIARIKEYVQEHYMKDIGINTIAQLYQITPNYLSKLFHERAGIKFTDYLTETRITAAKKLLASCPSITVKELSSRVGYFSARHFTKTFAKVTGTLPSKYLQQVGSDKNP